MNIPIEHQNYNAYFHPVGSYSGGYGNVSVRKQLRSLPIFEEDVCLIHAIHYDLSEDFEDGSKVDHKFILKNIILEKLNSSKNTKP